MKLIIINSNEKYLEWINSFNWKNNKPIIQKKNIYILLYKYFRVTLNFYLLLLVIHDQTKSYKSIQLMLI
jgi:hypothetical protein